MKMLFMKKPRLLAAAAFFVLAVCALFALLRLGYSAQNPPRVAKRALEEGMAVDLMDFDFETSIAYVRFRQAGEYYHNKILAPQEIGDHSPDDKSLVGDAEYRTHRVRFLVPDGNYMIFGKSPEYASRIYVNGELAASFGEIYENSEDNRYQIATYEIAAHPAQGVIEVVTNGADSIRFDADIYSIHIGRHDVALSMHLSAWIKNLIILGFVFACALFFIGYFVFTPHSSANLFCALIALSLGIRMMAADKIVTKMVGELDYRVTFFVENGMLLLIVVFYTLLIRSLFQDSIPKLLIKIVVSVNALLMAALVILPIRITAGFIWVHTALISVVALVAVVCILRHIRRFREEQIISFCGQVLFILIGLVELLYVQGVDVIPRGSLPSLTVIETTRVATLGLLLFIIAQMMALFLYNNRIAENEQKLSLENALLENLHRTKTELLGNISHELKTPLTAISNVSQLARMHASENYVQEKLDIAVAEVERMKLTVGHIIDLSRLEEADEKWNFAPIDIEGLITDTVSHYFQALNEHNNKLVIECPEALPKVRADAAKIEKVLVNLVNNAMRFTRNGQITVRAEWCNAETENTVLITVEDTGSGITTEQKERIFERFYTGDHSTGTGLGLYICKKIIDAHGGQISAQSEPGRGTAVSFTLRADES